MWAGPCFFANRGVNLVRSFVCCRRYAIGLAAAAGLALVGVVALTLSSQTHESSTLVVSEVYGLSETASAVLRCLCVASPAIFVRLPPPGR